MHTSAMVSIRAWMRDYSQCCTPMQGSTTNSGTSTPCNCQDFCPSVPELLRRLADSWDVFLFGSVACSQLFVQYFKLSLYVAAEKRDWTTCENCAFTGWNLYVPASASEGFWVCYCFVVNSYLLFFRFLHWLVSCSSIKISSWSFLTKVNKIYLMQQYRDCGWVQMFIFVV